MDLTETQLIVDAFRLLEETNPAWLRAIEDRPTGSQWGRFMRWQEIANLKWQRLPSSQRILGLHKPECLYYHYQKSDEEGIAEGLHPLASENIKLLSEFNSFQSIYIHDGAHGLELMSEEVTKRATSEAWLIIGPAKDVQGQQSFDFIVWTAYPGKIAICPNAHPDWDGTLDCLPKIAQSQIPVAIKGLK
jgi:hypothetical protein